MSPPRIMPFDESRIDAAGQLLAARHRRWHSIVPTLPERYCDVEQASALIREALRAGDGFALAAEDRHGSLLGYILGAPRLEEIWGRSAWVPLIGQCLADEADPDVIRDLYAAWADRWVERGIFAHYALVPADFPETVESWFSLGFGKMQAYALRSTDAASLGSAPTGVAIRKAEAADLDLVMELGDLIPRALMEAPTFAITLPERWPAIRADWADELEHPEGDVWLALDERSGRPLALAGFYPMEDGPAVPEHAVELGVAMTAPHARGRGVMRGLVRHGLEVAAAAGATICATDWRVANLTASRTWPALGFQPLYWRLHRMVDNRIVWARQGIPPAP